MNLNYINKIIGIDIPKEQAINNLASLGFKVDGENVLFPK
ncbi:hypothetical protein FACS189496_4690 [Bacilli bacterium]|nr:hypothetical protein FACS189496_4690 [Bacilli bacterium]